MDRIPLIPNGENSTTYRDHIKKMKIEMAKQNANKSLITNIMELTYPQRRRYILSKNMKEEEILNDFPCLRMPVQVRFS